MPKFRKKPVIIEAMQFDGTIESGYKIREWAHRGRPAIANSIVLQSYDGCLFINTLEGQMTACGNDWIIKDVKGGFYPCKPDIFEQTYELVED